MEKQVIKVGLDILMEKYQEIYHAMYGPIHYVGSVVQVQWYPCMGRNPQLSLRSVQVIKRESNQVRLEGMQDLFFGLSQYSIEWVIE